LRKVNSNEKSTVKGQLPMMTSARWHNLMTLALDADMAVMTPVGDPATRGACERVVQSSLKLLSVREGAWSVWWSWFFAGDVDRSKTIPMTVAVRWLEQYRWRVEKQPNLWLVHGGAWNVRWWWFWRLCVDRLKIYTLIFLMS